MPTKIVNAWRDWYHINGNTYGTWIRGDTRGWRARHHREHVEGDYKNPPAPDLHIKERELSRRLMEKPILLSMPARKASCKAIVASLRHQQTEIIACCVDGTHFHLLARFVMRSNTKPAPPTRN